MEQYLTEVNRFPLLTREEEQELARRWNEEEDMDAAQQLVTANLPLCREGGIRIQKLRCEAG